MRDEKESMFKRNVNINPNRSSNTVKRAGYEMSYSDFSHGNTSASDKKSSAVKKGKSKKKFANNKRTAHKQNDKQKQSNTRMHSNSNKHGNSQKQNNVYKQSNSRKQSNIYKKNNSNKKSKISNNPYANTNPPSGVSREEERRAHRDARRKQQKARRRIFYAIMIFIVLIIGIVLSLTVFFNITTIEVKGESIYGTEEIISASGIKTGDNLFLLKKSDIEQKVCENLPFVGSVTIKNSLPSKVILTVKQTSIKCAVESDGGYIMLDETGKVLCKVSTLEEVYSGAGVTPPSTAASTTEPSTDASTATTDASAGTTSASTSTTDTSANATTDSTTVVQNEGTSSDGTEEKKQQYVLLTDKIIILRGIDVKSAEPGKKLDVKNKKSFDLYEQIMKSFDEQEITGITAMDLSNTVEITLIYQDRITIEVGTIANLEKKMALAANVIKAQDEISPYQEGTINLTIDKQAYFSPKAEESTSKPEENTSEPETKN